MSAIQEGDDPATRREKYAADVTYGTNSEFGFDYLRDNMAGSLEECVQRGHDFAIVDEVDNILIDEARTPLIISGRPEQAADLYYTFARLAKQMEGEPAKKKLKSLGESKDTSQADYDYEYDEKHKTVAPTEGGITKAEEFLGVENLYLGEHGTLVNHLIQSLKAESLYKRDIEYAVVEGQVMIIDEFTGRILEGRRWSEGLHQAIEAKEGVSIREENQTLATITLQNYFRLYDKLSGMTGTALTEAQEFMKIYKVPTVEIPTNVPMVRADQNDAIYKTKERQVEARSSTRSRSAHKAGQPILVGTISVEISEMLSDEFKRRGIEHVVLNAKPEHAQREGETIAQAGRKGAVTIATNMAGRGVDIKLGGSPEHMAEMELKKQGIKPGDEGYEERLKEQTAEFEPEVAAAAEEIRELGGLFIVGTERHESRRIDNQLRGRSGRQGDPGESRFFLSAEDDLIRLFAGERIYKILDRLGPVERGGRGGGPRGQDAHQDDRGRPEEGRAAELPDPQARARVRRRDERAAPRDLPLPARDPRGQGHVRCGPRGAGRGRQPDGRGLHAGRHPRGVGPRRAPDAGAAALALGGRTSQTSSPRPPTASGSARPCSPTRSPPTTAASRSSATRSCAQLERAILLQIIDNRWREHLAEMDYLREGIHLRGFAQIDPLVAYKNEGFTMFEVLMHAIWEEFARLIFHVEVEVAPRAQEQLAPAQQPSNVQLLRRDSRGSAVGDAGDRGRSCGRRRRRRAQCRGDTGRGGRTGCGGGRRQRRRRDQPADGRQGRQGEDRPQRPLLVRLGQEVQEVPRGISPAQG